jgi:hypothetical protein
MHFTGGVLVHCGRALEATPRCFGSSDRPPFFSRDRQSRQQGCDDMQVEHPELGCKPEASGPNWPQVKADYEAGAIPIRQIATREGVSDTAIHKPRAEGWSGSLRASANPTLPGLQTDVQTTLIPAAEEIVQRIERAYATAANPVPKDDFEWKPDNDAVLLAGRPAGRRVSE